MRSLPARFLWLVTLAIAAACFGSRPGIEARAQAIAGNAYVHTDTIWNSPNIRVCWETPGYEGDKQLVRQAIERTWERESAVDFYGWGECGVWPSPMPLSMLPGIMRAPPNFRIRIADEGPHTTGLGRSLQGVSAGMVLNFTFQNWPCSMPRTQCISAIAVHEFGHALGFAHEQNRPDTPAWCREPPQGANGTLMIGAWDANSIMNYCHNSYADSGALSATDIAAVRAVYGARVALPVRTGPVRSGDYVTIRSTQGVWWLAPEMRPGELGSSYLELRTVPDEYERNSSNRMFFVERVNQGGSNELRSGDYVRIRGVNGGYYGGQDFWLMAEGRGATRVLVGPKRPDLVDNNPTIFFIDGLGAEIISYGAPFAIRGTAYGDNWLVAPAAGDTHLTFTQIPSNATRFVFAAPPSFR